MSFTQTRLSRIQLSSIVAPATLALLMACSSAALADDVTDQIDEAVKAETLAARKNGVSFGPEINVYDQFK